MNIGEDIKKRIEGDVDASDKTREFYSHDASLFELTPDVVVFPKNSNDVQEIVRYVNENKKHNRKLSIVPRTRGTDMSGGAIGESIVMDISRHMTEFYGIEGDVAHTQPGITYKEFDKITLKEGMIMPSYPASRELAGIGGIVNNNSGGEKSLQYGKTDRYVREMKMVLADGNEYTFKPLNRKELNAKMSQDDFEGRLYRDTFELLDKHYDEIQAAAPKVSKDSTGYHLWNVWNRETQVFDMTKLFVGAQGTLGLNTEVKLGLVNNPKYSGTLVCYMKDIDNLGEVIPDVLSHNPATFECFDDNTLWLSFKFIFSFIKTLGFSTWIKMCIQLIPDGLALVKGVPKMILLIEFSGESTSEVKMKIHNAHQDLKKYKNFTYMEEDETIEKSRKFWLMRRESFNLLRQKVKDKHTAPFIDDLVVPPEHLSEFLPQLRTIIRKYKLMATIAGHMGDGNFHIIPLMKIEDPKERAKFKPAMTEVNELVIKYGGSVSGEHNDGMIRGPWLEQMYSKSVLGYMKDIKRIFDPDTIFNPHKKTDATWDYSFRYIRKHF